MKQLELFTEGLKDINQSLELNPTYFKALRARGRIYVGLRLYESAIENFEAALQNTVILSVDANEVEELRVELENTEIRAAREVKDYYEILGE